MTNDHLIFRVTSFNVLNAAARVVTGIPKFDRGPGQILHDELHWLDVPDRVFFKVAVTVHRCLNGCAPSWTTASRSPVQTLGGICILPTVNYSQYLGTCSTLTAVRPFQLIVLQSGTLSWISSQTRASVQTVSDVCLNRICLLDTKAASTIQIYSLTYLFTY